MGERCAQYFREADNLGGIPAKVRLASLARVTSAEALAGPDDPVVISRLKIALDTLREELDGRTSLLPDPPAVGGAEGKLVARLRRHVGTFVDLMSQRALVLGDVREAARRVDEAAASALGVARVSVWRLDDARTKITCMDLFEQATSKHSAGAELAARDYAPYFDALATERTISAVDACHDSRTSCFAASYLKPLGIGAMLDVPIWVRGRMVGVICHEHIGEPRSWDADEERFAYLMSDFLAMAMEPRGAR